MCVGTPMRIENVDGVIGQCRDGEHLVTLDLSLVPDAKVGDWVLGFLGVARQQLDPEDARLIREALGAVAAAMQGFQDESAFADLVNREPTLPPHMEAARAAGRSEA